MFIDWLDIYQDHKEKIPLLNKVVSIEYDTVTESIIRESQPTIKHKGSFSTSIQIRISNQRITISGNPSRINRLDNLFGFTSLDEAINCYNVILTSLGLPIFTKGIKFNMYPIHGTDRYKVETDGAVITRIDLTTNKSVGKGNELDYLKGVSTLSYRYQIPRLHTNGATVDWLNKKGAASSLIYPCVYSKAYEINLNSLPKIKRIFGVDSEEYKYLKTVHQYCVDHGVVRFEQKLRSAFLRKHSFRHYGFFDFNDLKKHHQEFLDISQKLQVTSMSLESISQRLVRLGLSKNTRTANTTAMYAIMWMNGQHYDSSKTQVRLHRATLKKIGIDIYQMCDLSRHSAVYVRQAREVSEQPLMVPSWYQKPTTNLRLVA